jgi:hypothetical protein
MPDRISSAMAEDALGAGIPKANNALPIRRDNRIRARGEECVWKQFRKIHDQSLWFSRPQLPLFNL